MSNGKLIALLFTLCFSAFQLQAQRFKDNTFSRIDSVVDVHYGEALNIKNDQEKLYLDLYMPSNDTLKKRPVLLFFHGGGFQNGNRKQAMAQNITKLFASKGYVTVSVSYRLGIEKTKSDKDYAEALYRAQQDGRTAIRFLKANADKWGLDTAQFFLTGTSAGAKTCLAIAYMDNHEIPGEVDVQKWGGREGDNIFMNYSSSVKGVMNLWGGMINYKWINNGDVPLYNTAGTLDKTVPFDSSYAYHGFKYGPYILYRHCLEKGIATAWRPFYGVGHTLDTKKANLDSCFQEMGVWLYTRLAINKPVNDKGITRFENEIARFDSLNKTEKHSKDAVLIIGSSYVRLWKNIREDLKYKDIIHRGFGGSNLSEVAYYAKRIIYPHDPKAIFFYVGNDIVDGVRDKTPLQVLELFKYVVSVIRAKYPDIPITWFAVSPSEKRWTVWHKIQEANKLIEEYCHVTQGLHYVSATKKFLDKKGNPNKALYLNDKLHYNEAGYKVWGKAIRSEVHRIIAKQTK